MKSVCLTFDDGQIEHFTLVPPILYKYDFRATFFINGQMSDQNYRCHSGLDIKFMNWDQVKELSKDHEIGNHGYFHRNFAMYSICEEDLFYVPEKIGQECISFCYPAYHYNIENIETLRKNGYLYARAGTDKPPIRKKPSAGASGMTFNPVYDNPLNIQCLGIFGKRYGYKHFVNDTKKIEDNTCGIFNFHGIGNGRIMDITLDEFDRCMRYLHEMNFNVITMSEINNIINRNNDFKP